MYRPSLVLLGVLILIGCGQKDDVEWPPPGQPYHVADVNQDPVPPEISALYGRLLALMGTAVPPEARAGDVGLYLGELERSEMEQIILFLGADKSAAMNWKFDSPARPTLANPPESGSI